MAAKDMQQGALITREAYLALLDLKRLVDAATQKIHAAQLETVGLAVGHPQGPDPLQTLQLAVETVRSRDFEATVLQARAKMETAIAWHVTNTAGGILRFHRGER